MDINYYNARIKDDLERYQNVLGKENWSKMYLSFTDETVSKNSLVVIAGRPRTGKTSLLLDFIARNSLKPKEENDIFYNDIMSRKGLVYFIGHKEEVVLRKWFSIVTQSLISNKMTDQSVEEMHEQYLERIKEANINFNFYCNTQEVANVIEKDVNSYKPDYIVIDSLIVKYEFDEFETERYQLKDELLTSAIELQKKTKKFVLLSVVLGHDAWYRYSNNHHSVEDLHSIEIETNADVVFVLHRPEMFNLEIDEQGNSLKKLTELVSVINRYGEDRVEYKWIFEKGIPVMPSE